MKLLDVVGSFLIVDALLVAVIVYLLNPQGFIDNLRGNTFVDLAVGGLITLAAVSSFLARSKITPDVAKRVAAIFMVVAVVTSGTFVAIALLPPQIGCLGPCGQAFPTGRLISCNPSFPYLVCSLTVISYVKPSVSAENCSIMLSNSLVPGFISGNTTFPYNLPKSVSCYVRGTEPVYGSPARVYIRFDEGYTVDFDGTWS